ETRVGRRLGVNLHAARSRTMLDEAGDMLALRAFTDIPARPCEAAPPTNPDSLSLPWLIPDFQQGAGGHMNIFRIARPPHDPGKPPVRRQPRPSPRRRCRGHQLLVRLLRARHSSGRPKMLPGAGLRTLVFCRRLRLSSGASHLPLWLSANRRWPVAVGDDAAR